MRWEITSGDRRYIVGKRGWTPDFADLAVFFDDDNRFVGDLPDGVSFGFSIRQAVRRRLSDGLVLEDEGIEIDHYYRMTRNDVLSRNVDLVAFACNLLEPSKISGKG
jgi:hypothetical protein